VASALSLGWWPEGILASAKIVKCKDMFGTGNSIFVFWSSHYVIQDVLKLMILLPQVS
jgi:hypothetical protein